MLKQLSFVTFYQLFLKLFLLESLCLTISILMVTFRSMFDRVRVRVRDDYAEVCSGTFKVRGVFMFSVY